MNSSTGEAEFKIVVTENGKYWTKYELIPIGMDYRDEIKNHPILTIINDGNGYIIDKIGKHLEYYKAAYLFILLSFMNKHETDEKYGCIYSGRIEKVETETILKM
jgi:hypothetical protein